MSKRRWRRIHKCFGVVISIFIILYAISGIVLNHRQFFSGIDISRAWLPQTYEYNNWNNGLVRGSISTRSKDLPAKLAYGASGIWAVDNVSQSVSSFLEGLPRGAHHQNIRALVETPQGDLFAASQFDLYRWSDHKWSRVDVGYVYEKRLSDLTLKGDTLVLLSRSYVYLSTYPYQDWSKVELPKSSDFTGKVTLLKVIWEIHSGAYFGLVGRLLVDLLAFAMILLCVTGIIHFILPNRIKRLKYSGRSIKNTVKFLKDNVHIHNKVGIWLIIFLLAVTVTGMFLRPPLLLSIVRGRVSPTPHSSLDSPNPWNDQLRMIRYDYEADEWLMSTSKGFYRFKSFDSMPKYIDYAPKVSVMGINVMEQTENGEWLIASFSGAYRWNRSSGIIKDYFTDQTHVPKRGMPTFDQRAISGYSQDYDLLFDYTTGNEYFVPMPEGMKTLPMSLYNVMLEVHTGRIFTFLPFPDAWFAFVIGSLILLILISGWVIRYRQKKRGR